METRRWPVGKDISLAFKVKISSELGADSLQAFIL